MAIESLEAGGLAKHSQSLEQPKTPGNTGPVQKKNGQDDTTNAPRRSKRQLAGLRASVRWANERIGKNYCDSDLHLVSNG